MASLKSKAKKAAKVENTSKQVEEMKEVAEEKNLTKAESEAIVAQKEAEKDENASTAKLEKTTALLSGKFNLDNSYTVTQFVDKGKVVKMTFENKDFILHVDVKDSEKHALNN